MGLYCTAYSNIELTPDVTEADWEDDQILAFAYVGFEQSTRGLVDHDQVGPRGFLCERVYSTTGSNELGWHAGSYGGYGEFRRLIASNLAGVQAEQVWRNPDEYRSIPFFELIHFADNEGTIGSAAAADLLVDFTHHREQWWSSVGTNSSTWLGSVYDEWIAALILAGNNGCVVFS